MVRQCCSKGYTLLELCISLGILSVLFLLVLPFMEVNRDFDDYLFESKYLLTQSEAMDERSNKMIDDSGCELNASLYFNASGNVSQGASAKCNQRLITIQLGGGRLVEK